MKPSHFIILFILGIAFTFGAMAVSDGVEAWQISKLDAGQQSIVIGQRQASKGLRDILIGVALVVTPISLAAVLFGRGNNVNTVVTKGGGGKSDAAQMEIENMPPGWMDTFAQQQPQRGQLPPPQNHFALSAPAPLYQLPPVFADTSKPIII